METSTSWERQCHSRAHRVKGMGRKELDSGPRMNAHLGEEQGVCMASIEVEVRFARRLILSTDQKCRCWLVGDKKLCYAAGI